LYLGEEGGVAPTPAATLAPGGPDAAMSVFGCALGGGDDVTGDGLADVVVGAPGAYAGEGRAYLYAGSSAGLDPTPRAVLSGAGGNFGRAVATLRDVNGDGHADVVVGAPAVPPADLGRVYTFFGGASATWSAPSSVLGPRPGALGRALADANICQRY
jgi:hypothetical protein